MRLNDSVPGLPAWPAIDEIKKGEIVVHAKHLSFARYKLAWIISILITLVYGYYVYEYARRAGRADYEGHGLSIGVKTFSVWFSPYFFATMFIPIPRILGRLFLRRTTSVRFTPSKITVNRRAYSTEKGVAIQFRASLPHLREAAYERYRKGTNSNNAAYQMKFRKVEMIYGSRIVHVTSIDNKILAEQFAVALQNAYDLVNSREPIPNSQYGVVNFTMDDTLPE